MKLIFFALLLNPVFGYRILGVLHVPTPSHYIIGEAVLKELANRGHDVTIVSPFKAKNPNYREIYLDGLTKLADEVRSVFFDLSTSNSMSVMTKFSNYTNMLTDFTLRNAELQKLMQSGETFDLVLVEPFGNEALFGLQHVFRAHLGIICTSTSSLANPFAGNVAPYSFVPHSMASYSDRMSFQERFWNTLLYIFMGLFNQFLTTPVQKSLYEEMFKNVPSFEETTKNVSIILINSHVVFETPRPYLPNMIPISGAHLKEPKKLPQDLQSYMDTAKDGVVFFSLGSNLHSRFLPKETQQIILRTFAKFPQKFIWKFEENLENVPSNVMTSKWLPQTDILGHPNTKLFITHGGLLSTTEAVFRGVPIIGIPVYGDQYSNIAKMVDSGYGKSISLETINEEDFTNIIKEVLNNPIYSQNIKKTANLLKDQLEKPLDRAVYWLEYTIRHNGARHLRSASLDIPLYQYLLLDVIAVILSAIFISTTLVYTIIKFLCCSRKKENAKPKKVKPKRE